MDLEEKINLIIKQNSIIIKQNSLNEALNGVILNSLGISDKDINRIVKKLHKEFDLEFKKE